MRENRPYGSVGGWGLIAPRLPNQYSSMAADAYTRQIGFV